MENNFDNKNIDPSKIFYSSDFGLCVTLKAHDCEILEIDRRNRRRVYIYFMRTPKLEEIVLDYHSGKIPYKKMFETIKDIKRMIYEPSL